MEEGLTIHTTPFGFERNLPLPPAHHPVPVYFSVNPNFFLGDYLENTDYNFKEAYLVDANGCTNWEDHDGACVIGCQKGTGCSGHSCSCGGAKGPFMDLATAVADGTCGEPGQSFQQFTATVAKR